MDYSPRCLCWYVLAVEQLHFYPTIHTIAIDLGVAITLINLTITSYMMVYGVTPGDLADMVGRRPVYLATFLIYFAANIGLALQRS